MVRRETVQSTPELADFAEGSRCTSDCRDVYWFHHYWFPDDNANATFLVALSSCWVCYLQQLVDERVLVFDLGEFRHQVDYSPTRWCERTPKAYSVLSRSNFRRIYYWWYMESDRHYDGSTDVPVLILKFEG